MARSPFKQPQCQARRFPSILRRRACTMSGRAKRPAAISPPIIAKIRLIESTYDDEAVRHDASASARPGIVYDVGEFGHRSRSPIVTFMTQRVKRSLTLTRAAKSRSRAATGFPLPGPRFALGARERL